jgi:hypothetical protein
MKPLFIIYLQTKARRVPKIGGYIFNERHGKYLWKGRPLTAEEFNAAAEEVFDREQPHITYKPTVRVLHAEKKTEAKTNLELANS